MTLGRGVIGTCATAFSALAALFAAPAGSASPPAIEHPGEGSFTAPLTNTCAGPITLNGSFSRDILTTFFDRSGNVTAVSDRFEEVDTFVGPTGATLVGDPYHAITQVRFDSAGNPTSVESLAVLERIMLPDGTKALFAGRLNLLTAPPGTFDFVPDAGHSSDLAGLCAALDAGLPLS